MKFIEAAEKVLRQTRRPMHSREIVEYAISRGWLKTQGKTPAQTLQGVLWVDRQKKGTKSVFRVVGNSPKLKKFTLKDQ